MAVGTSDGEYYEDPFEMTVAQLGDKAYNQAKTIQQGAEYLSQGANEMPPTAQGKPAGAFKSELGTEVAGRNVFSQLTGNDGGERYKLWPERMVSDTLDHIKNFMTTEPGSQENIEASTNVAAALGMGGLVTAPMKPGVGMFGGRMSQPAINQAERLEASGYSPTTVKEISGLERGKDGYWRKEFGDDKATYNPENFTSVTVRRDAEGKDLENLKANNLGAVLDHPELYKVYPEAEKIGVALDPDMLKTSNRGIYHSAHDVISLRPGMSKEQTRETLLHEIQHWIQHQEGFSMETPNSIPSSMADKVMKDYILQNHKPTLKEINSLINEGKGSHAQLEAAFILDDAKHEVYSRLASEVEARNTALRSKMSDAQRRKSLGSNTEDVPREDQIVVHRKPSQP